MNKIDLHIHTTASLDADYSPSQIVKMAKKAKLNTIAIADHDTADGVKEAVKAGKDLGVKVVPAIEISCAYKNINLHILGYGIDIENKKYADLLENVRKQERAGSQKSLELIKDLGIYVNMDKLNSLIKDGIIIGENIGEASIYEPENQDNPLIKPFLNKGPLSDNPFVNFYWKFCSQGAPAYVNINFPDLKDVIELIKADKGLAVFAHPGNNIKEDETLLYEIMKAGLDGIEAYSSYHSQDQVDFYISHAEKNNWLITCGSDFHGKNKPSIKLGDINILDKHEEVLLKTVKDMYHK